MIEQLLANKDTIPYALACFCIVLAVVVGYMFGYQEPSAVCAEYIITADEQTKKAQELNTELTECESKKAGGCVLKCSSICDKQVLKALDNHKKILCED
tara:strand:- start:347 stop:643 length:297 start_codon:yes stop_codon:yes gene_type:complete